MTPAWTGAQCAPDSPRPDDIMQNAKCKMQNESEATGNRQQATDPPVAAHSVRHAVPRPDDIMQNAKCKMQNESEATGNRQQATDPPVAAHSVRHAVPRSDDPSVTSHQSPEGGKTVNCQLSTVTCHLSTVTCHLSLPPAWDALLSRPFDREPHRRTLAAAEAAASLETVYPPRADWFAALRLTPPERIRVVILGQDPYHEPDQAMGLAFSVRPGVKLPPSLRNIYKELEADLGLPSPADGDLTPWAEQGVLLLNTVLTVAAGRANSHKNLGWQALTGEILAAVSRLPQPIAFVLWGAPAQRAYAQATQNAKCKMQNDSESPVTSHQATGEFSILNSQFSISNSPPPRLILTAPHPSPLSAYRGFFGSRPFSQINAFLTAHGKAPIRWTD